MEFRPGGYDTHKHHNQPYHMPFTSSSSDYTYFSQQAMKVGLSSGTSGGGSLVRLEVLRGSVDIRQIIRRQLDKERIREDTIAQEIERKRILDEEVRRELMIERETMHYGSGFPSSFMPDFSHCHRLLHSQSFPPEYRRIEMPLKEMYGVPGGHHRAFRGFEAVPFHRAPTIQEITASPPEENKDVFIGLGMPHGAKRKPPPSSELHSNHSKKKRNEKFSCAVCKVTATCEHAFNEHLAGRKHRYKMTALRAQDTSASTSFERSKKAAKKRASVIKKKLTSHVKFQRKGDAESRKSNRKRKKVRRKQK